MKVATYARYSSDNQRDASIADQLRVCRAYAALAEVLEQPETRTEATEALRGLIDAITLTPDQGARRIELKGNLAAMLGAAQNAKRSPESDDLSLQVVLVAGACNRRYLQLWSGAA